MYVTIHLENSVLLGTKLLVWEGGINFSFIEWENVKGISMIFWTDSNLFLIKLTFQCPKNKFLGCLDFVFLKKEKERFSKFIWLLPSPSKVPWEMLFKNLELHSVSGLSLSKALFSWEIIFWVSVKSIQMDSAVVAMLLRFNIVMTQIYKIVFYGKFLSKYIYMTTFTI